MASRASRRETSADESAHVALRHLPPVEECLNAADRDPALAEFSRTYLKSVMRKVLTDLRREIVTDISRLPASRERLLEEALQRTRAAINNDQSTLTPIVNATGVVLHTNFGRALLAESAIEAMVLAARSAVNLEYAIANGARGDRDDLVEAELCALTDAEAATVVNNNAAAVLLVLNTLAAGREVIVSRGELVEIGGSFRIPDVMARAQVRLREVGTTNRTHPRDYRDAIGPETALLMKVHPSNYQIVGFTAQVDLADLVAVGRAHQIDVVEDLGAGALIDLSLYGLPREPIVAERIAAGAALVTFSADKLLGGPQGGIVVGRRDLIQRLKANPLWRALRCDKLRLAALEATLRLYRRSANLAGDLPTLRLLSRNGAELALLAERARELLVERLGAAFTIEVVISAAQIGSGSLPTETLESRALRLTHPSLTATEIGAAFRQMKVIGRISDDTFLLDLIAIEDPAALAVKPRFAA
jgi:L-seryl-tRNA(Ser) seleniumtransferase